VPIKIIFGNPFHLELTVIIIVSMVVSSVMTIGVIYLIKRRKAIIESILDGFCGYFQRQGFEAERADESGRARYRSTSIQLQMLEPGRRREDG
jgi:hypothetical protein